jgi:hypothetical protein
VEEKKKSICPLERLFSATSSLVNDPSSRAGACLGLREEAKNACFARRLCHGPGETFMNLKLVVTIFVLTVMPTLGQVPADRPPAKPTKVDVQRVVQMIGGDKTRMETYCDLAKINQQIVLADEMQDAKAIQTLKQKADESTQKLGPDFVKLMDGLDEADDNSGEGKDMAASFDEINAAFEFLDKQCK